MKSLYSHLAALVVGLFAALGIFLNSKKQTKQAVNNVVLETEKAQVKAELKAVNRAKKIEKRVKNEIKNPNLPKRPLVSKLRAKYNNRKSSD